MLSCSHAHMIDTGHDINGLLAELILTRVCVVMCLLQVSVWMHYYSTNTFGSCIARFIDGQILDQHLVKCYQQLIEV